MSSVPLKDLSRSMKPNSSASSGSNLSKPRTNGLDPKNSPTNPGFDSRNTSLEEEDAAEEEDLDGQLFTMFWNSYTLLLIDSGNDDQKLRPSRYAKLRLFWSFLIFGLLNNGQSSQQHLSRWTEQ